MRAEAEVRKDRSEAKRESTRSPKGEVPCMVQKMSLRITVLN